MDVWATWPGACTSKLIDVTIRCPLADRYPSAPKKAGAAASTAACEKYVRYGASVLSLEFETYGRLGVAGMETLRTLANEAGTYGRDRWAQQRLVGTSCRLCAFGCGVAELGHADQHPL